MLTNFRASAILVSSSNPLPSSSFLPCILLVGCMRRSLRFFHLMDGSPLLSPKFIRMNSASAVWGLKRFAERARRISEMLCFPARALSSLPPWRVPNTCCFTASQSPKHSHNSLPLLVIENTRAGHVYVELRQLAERKGKSGRNQVLLLLRRGAASHKV